MKTILYAAAIAVVLASAWFSFSLKSKIENEIDVYNTTEAKNFSVDAKIRSTENTLTDVTETLDAAKTKEEELRAKKDLEEGDKEKFEAAIQAQNTAIDGYDAELAEVAQLIKRIEDVLDGAGVAIDQIPDEIEKLKNEKLDLQQQLE
mgnify:CR=1 FL=1